MKALLAVSFVLELLLSCNIVEAKKHHLFVSSYRTQHIFSLSYDEEANSLQLEKTIVTHGGHPWLALNKEKTVLYAGERSSWSSYDIAYPSDLFFSSNIALNVRCEQPQQRQGQTVLVASQNPPFKVYGAGRSPCGVVLDTQQNGVLSGIAQNITFRPASRVQGMAMDPQGRFLFSADQEENGVWVHKVDPNTGMVDRGRVAEMPIEDSRPRRLAMHPAGRYLYVLFRKLNRVGVFEIVQNNDATRLPRLRYTNASISLIPEGVDTKRYRGSEISISEDGRILYGTVRYRERRNRDDEGGGGRSEDDEDDEDTDYSTASPNAWGSLSQLGNAIGKFIGGAGNNRGGNTNGRGGSSNNRGNNGRPKKARRDSSPTIIDQAERLDQMDTLKLSRRKEDMDKVHTAKSTIKSRQAPNAGILTAVLLSDPENDKTKGFPLQMVMQSSTSTTGGKSNIITPAAWDPSVFAISDSEQGLVQIWRIAGVDKLPKDGPRNRFNGASFQRKGTDPGIQATILAEWRAPPEAVGNPNVSSRGNNDKVRADSEVTGQPASRVKRQESYSTTDSTIDAIPSGRGCCANAIWLD